MRFVTNTPAIAIVGLNGATATCAATNSNLPRFQSVEAARHAGAEYILNQGPDGLELLAPNDKPGQGVRCDFRSFDLRVATGNRSRNQPLGRAIGKNTQTIIDATAGLGYDSILLAAMGCRVTAIERSPILAALFEDGLRRAREHAEWVEVVDNIQLIVGDAKDCLSSLKAAPDAIYIDPMFPPKRKAALPPKRIRIVREIVGDDVDAADLLAIARRTAHRVVVKRPSHAPPIADDRSHKVETKLVRYDVYVSNVVLGRNVSQAAK